MRDFSEYTDEELVKLGQDGDGEAVDFLLNKYKGMVRAKARTMFLLGGEEQDLSQEGMIGMVRALRDYTGDRGASFSTFAQLCVSRQIYTAVQASNRKKHSPLNNYVSLYDEEKEENAQEDGSRKRSLTESLPDPGNISPESLMLGKEKLELLRCAIEEQLSKYEKEVLHLYLQGEEPGEIAKILGKSQKSIENARQRIKNKLKPVLDEDQ